MEALRRRGGKDTSAAWPNSRRATPRGVPAADGISTLEHRGPAAAQDGVIRELLPFTGPEGLVVAIRPRALGASASFSPSATHANSAGPAASSWRSRGAG